MSISFPTQQEEGPMEALSARPININRAILEEKASGLSKYENKGSYLDFPPFCDTSPQNKDECSPQGTFKESVETVVVEDPRIRSLVHEHHSKIVQAKLNKTQSKAFPLSEKIAASNSFIASPPPQLVSALRKVYGTQATAASMEQNNTDDRINSSVGNVLPTLLQNIFEHKIFSCEDGDVARIVADDSEEISSNFSEKLTSTNIEAIIGNACVSKCDDGESLQGLLIAAMSILVTSLVPDWFNEDSSLKHTKSLFFEADQAEDGIQASGPLSLLCDEIDDWKVLDEMGGRKFIPDRKLMEYFKNASVVYEQRLEIQKSRNICQQPVADTSNKSESLQEKSHSMEGDNSDSNSCYSSDESTPIFHSKSSSENKNESGEESNLGESEHRQPHSHQSSAHGNEHAYNLIEEQDPGDETQLLQEALALSLADINSVIDAIANESDRLHNQNAHNFEEGAPLDDQNIRHDIDKDIADGKTSDVNNFDETLPSFPAPPDNKLLREIWNKSSQFDVIPEQTKMLDPSAFSDFGKLPAANTFIILLSALVKRMETKGSSWKVGTTSSKQNRIEKETKSKLYQPVDTTSVTGWSCRTFQMGPDEEKHHESVLHLALACLFILSDARHLCFKSLCEQSDSAFGHVTEVNEGENTSEDDYYSTEDPAGLLTDVRSNVDARVSSEYLEEKGLIRKAAASAHFAALRRERIFQKIESLIEMVHVLSVGSFLVLRYLRMLLQEFSFQNCVNVYQSPLSSAVQARLAASLSSFTCPSLYNQHNERFNHRSFLVKYREKICESSCASFLLLEASSLWGESILFVALSTNHVEQMIKSLVDTITSKAGFISEWLSQGKLHSAHRFDAKWSIKDESVLKLNSLCRRLKCSDALSAIVPRPIADATSDVILPLPSPTSILCDLQLLIFEAIDTMNYISQSVPDFYLALCHRINIRILQWGGAFDSTHTNAIHLCNNKQKCSVDESRLWVGDDPLLKFDRAKCSGTIAIVSEGLSETIPQSAIQRAHRVWGTVFGKKCFKPKSGIYRWAVHMNACEKGHIFIGVVTAKASTKTYVGGDKFGWGMIGTKALWHDRKKVNTEYGKIFRTGDTIVLTLDTDSGTLKYSLWKKHTKTSVSRPGPPDSDDSIFMNGSLEDWGIAFEGLPLDASLYPAVGMYQRDDKATLVALERSKYQIYDDDRETGRCFFPNTSETVMVRKWNEKLCYEGIKYVSIITDLFSEHLSKDEVSRKDLLFGDILPCFLSSISLVPSSIPVLSGRFAYNLLPVVLRFLSMLESKIEEKSKILNPVPCMKSGAWSISYDGNTSYNYSGEKSEYFENSHHVELNVSFRDIGDSYEICSVNRESTDGGLVVCGSLRGNLVHLIEYNTDSNEDSTCRFIEARSNLDGTRFEGTYRNFRDDSTGTVSAVNIRDLNRVDLFPCSTLIQKWLSKCSFLLGIAAEHLLLILSEGAPSRDIYSRWKWEQSNLSRFSELVTTSIILREGFKENEKTCKLCLDRIRDLFEISQNKFDAKRSNIISSWYHDFGIRMLSVQGQYESDKWIGIPSATFDIIDEKISILIGGVGSLSKLHPTYSITRKGILRVLLYHTGCMGLLSDVKSETDQVILEIWRCALNVMEAGVRSALMKAVSNRSLTVLCKDYCHLLQQISSFLLEFQSPTCPTDVCLSALKDIYLGISSKDEIAQLREIIIMKSMNAVLKCIGLDAVHESIRMPSCSLASYGCMLSGFCQVSSPERTADNSLGHSSYHFVPAACAVLQNFAVGIHNKIFTIIASFLREKIMLDELNKPLLSSTQSFILSTISCLFTFKMIQSENLRSHLAWDLNENVLSGGFSYLDGCSVFDFNLVQSVADVSSTWIIKFSVWRSDAAILVFLSRLLHCTIFQHIDGNFAISNHLRILKMRLLAIIAYFGERYRSCSEDYSIMQNDFETWNITGSNFRVTELREIQTHRKNVKKLRIELPYDKRMSSSFEIDYLDSILSSLFTATRLQEAVPVILQDIPFVKAILRFLDESLDMNVEMISNLRNRLVRLLRFILPDLEPDENLLLLLFTHLGKIQSFHNGNPAAYVECKEVVSLVRCLCSSSRWRDCIVTFMSGSSSTTPELLMPFISVLGGLPGLLSDGSFVLLKPAHKLPPSIPADLNQGKGRVSSSFAGKDLEGIVSGLCRVNTLPGIVSTCDEEKSTCEVVLIERDKYVPDAKSYGHCFQPTISIRFVRVPFSDITPTDELGLLLDETLTVRFLSSTDLIGAIHSILQELNTSANSDVSVKYGKHDNILFSDSAKLLRCFIPILSIPKLYDRLIQNTSFDVVLPIILQFASITSIKTSYATSHVACNSGLKYLPELEARYWHLHFLRSRILKRQDAVLASSSEVIRRLESEYDDWCIRYGGKSIISSTTTDGLNQSATNLERRQTASSYDDNSFNSNEEANHLHDNQSEGQEDEAEENAESDQLREVAVIQMMELGLPRSWAEYALQQVGGTDIEAAVHFCLERGSELERLVAEQSEQRNTSLSASRRNEPGISHLLQQLIDMGFPSHWCAEALAATGQNVDDALTWILTNGERLNALDEEGHDEENSESDEDDSASEEGDDSDTNDGSESNLKPDTSYSTPGENSQMWPDSILCPVRSIAGRAKVDTTSLQISGVSSGGFTSVGTNGVLLTKGKWYYECILVTAGCIQIGWADSSFSSHCQADKGDGCGDGPSSWAYDGWRRYRWHTNATEWGCRWHVGDVVGCLLDMDRMEISFTLNGKGKEIGMGLAFSGNGFKPCGGVYACVSFNRKEKVRLLLGGTGNGNFNYPPPPGYRPVGEAVVVATQELGCLLKEEMILNGIQRSLDRKSFLCDFSGSEHGYEIFAWQHRYYGSDASVHLSIAPPAQRAFLKNTKSFLNGTMEGDKTNYDDIIDRVLSKIMTHSSTEHDLNKSSMRSILNSASNEIIEAYRSIHKEVDEEFQDVSLALCILYARKAILHFAAATSNNFKFSWFYPEDGDEVRAANALLTIFELCCSLQHDGWVGEAGAMSLASEALGLTISTKTGYNTCKMIGSTAMLNSVYRYSSNSCTDPINSIAACAEYQLAMGGLGAASFFRNALKSAMSSSKILVDVMLAFIRRSLRLIAGVHLLQESRSDVTLSMVRKCKSLSVSYCFSNYLINLHSTFAIYKI
jgi:hypothetical protein